MAGILVTGSGGLIGTALCAELESSGRSVTGLDRVAGGANSIVHSLSADDDLEHLVRGFDGVIHFAGMTRVKWGEGAPAQCWAENALMTERLAAACCNVASRPWFIYASSREVYGEPAVLPVADDFPVAPINVYGRSKVAAEAAVERAGTNGLRVASLRFSTVYGGVGDHADRLFPALMQSALANRPLTLNGAHTIVDPTWIDDAVFAVVAVAERLADGETPDGPILICGGTGASLAEIAEGIVQETTSTSAIVERRAREYDTSRFVGAPVRARRWLGWSPQTSLAEGVRRYAARLTQ